MTAVINFYTSGKPDGQLQTIARLAGEEYNQVVQIHPPSVLPQPDTQRPTRQQLRKELVDVQQELVACKNLIAMSEPFADKLANELAELEKQKEAFEVRIDQIKFTLGISKGGPAL
jgi:hypothetical protein